MIYDKLTEIPIRNYLNATNGDLKALNKDGHSGSDSDLNTAFNKLMDEKIDTFGIDKEVAEIIELESRMAVLLADNATDEKDLTEYYYLEPELKGLYEKIGSGKKSIEADIISMIHKGSDFKILFSPINNTAYEMLTAIKSINNVRR